MANECKAYYDDADDLTVHAAAAVTGKRFVKISATKQVASQALAASGLGGNIVVVPATAGVRGVGVAKYDIASGAKGGIHAIGSGRVIPVTAGAPITAGAELEVDATGRVITFAAGIKVGMAMADASGANVDCMVKIY